MNTKIAIEYEGTKRALDMPFSICLDRVALKYLVRELQSKLDDTTWAYGWVEIRQPYESKSQPGLEPLGWHR